MIFSQESFPRSRTIIIYVLCSSIKVACFDYHDYPSYSGVWSQRSLGDQQQISPSPSSQPFPFIMCCVCVCCNASEIILIANRFENQTQTISLCQLYWAAKTGLTFRTIRNDLKRSGEEFFADSKPFVHLQRLQSLRRKWKHLENLVYFCRCFFFFFYFFFSFFLLQHDRFSWSCCSASRSSNSK